MITELYSVKDTKVGFARPFHQVNRDQALRSFKWLREDENSDINKAPGDYELWFVGYFDDATGIISGGQPEYITNGRDVK